MQMYTHIGNVKLHSQPVVATESVGRSRSRLLYILDETSNLKFLVDSGAEISVVPPTFSEKRINITGPKLQAINNTDY